MLKLYASHKDWKKAWEFTNQKRCNFIYFCDVWDFTSNKKVENFTFDPKLKWQQKLKQKPGVPKNQDCLSEHVFDIPTENFILDR